MLLPSLTPYHASKHSFATSAATVAIIGVVGAATVAVTGALAQPLLLNKCMHIYIYIHTHISMLPQALCGCLAASGEVPADRLLAMMHRKRFEAAVRRHPCTSHESLETIAQSRELVLVVSSVSGPQFGALYPSRPLPP